MKKRLLSIALALSLIAPVCATPTAEAYHNRRIEEPMVLTVGRTSGLITQDGTLWMWGENGEGQVGDGTGSHQWSPEKVMSDVKSIATTGVNTAAIKKDGSLWIWGESYFLLDYKVDNCYKPVKFMEKVADVISYSSGYFVTKEDRSLWVIGDCGIEAATPQKILDNVCSMTCGNGHHAAIKEDGSLWMWGYNYNGQLGDGTTENRKTPVKVLDNVKSVSLGDDHSTAVKTDGSLWIWGDNSWGQLGDGTDEERTRPVKLMDNVKSVVADKGYTAVIKTDGSLWMWGDNLCGQLGDGTQEDRILPIKVMDGVAEISLFDRTSAALKTDGSLWMWGDNDCGQVGDGTREDRSVPKKVLDSVMSVLNMGGVTAAIKEDGTIWVWGRADGLGLGQDFKGYKQHYNEQKGWHEYDYVDKPTQLKGFTASAPKCTITLNLNGGDGTTKITCHKNGTITPPNNPSRDGYFFAGWYKDKACTKPWNFDTDKVTGNCTLYAKWEPKSTTTVTAEPSTQKVEIDGKKIILNSYVLRNDQGYPVNFVKLRDIAFLLDGTEANFNVDWRNNAIRLDARQPYTTPNGAEMTVPTVAAAPAKTSLTPVLTGGVTAPLEAFLLTDQNGGGHNYFKLRDIGKVAGFNVEWDGARGIIVVTTTEDYIG